MENPTVPAVDITALETMVAETNEHLTQLLQMQGSIYVTLLFLVGVGGALLVLFLLYKALKKFI